MRVLVTGANGFIGRYVVAALLARGHEVRALVRRNPRGLTHEAGRVEHVVADLSSTADLGPAFDRIDALIHLAAALHGTATEQRATTVEGTRQLLAAMARTSTHRLVLASSLAVYDWDAVGETVCEDSPLLPESGFGASGPYAAAKAQQERLTRRISSEHEWRLTVLRPGFVWGGGASVPACLGMRLGPAFLVVGPRSRRALCYVENCADLFATAVDHPQAVGQTFIAVDDDEMGCWHQAGDLLRGSGHPGLRVPVPYVVAAPGARLVHALLARVGTEHLHSGLAPARFRARFRPIRTSAKAAREILGWRPPWSYREALGRAFDIGSAGPGP